MTTAYGIEARQADLSPPAASHFNQGHFSNGTLDRAMVRDTDPLDKRLALRRDMRIRRSADFDAAYQANVRRSAGPLMVHARPNGLNHVRLGMAVPSRVGGAVARNSIRRRLREAFRHVQYDLPQGYDFVVSVRPHEMMTSIQYREFLLDAAHVLHEKWIRKQNESE